MAVLLGAIAQTAGADQAGIDPVDRFSYIAQCHLWFPETKVQVGAAGAGAAGAGHGAGILPPFVRGDDSLAAGRRHPLGHVAAAPRDWPGPQTLVWDREATIGGSGKLTASAAAFAGTLATRIKLAPPRDPEYKGIIERNNGYLETSFLPGRQFASPADFNQQLREWLVKANSRTVRSIQGRPVDLLERDYLSMTPLPPVDPPTGLSSRIRLARDYYLRVDTGDGGFV